MEQHWVPAAQPLYPDRPIAAALGGTDSEWAQELVLCSLLYAGDWKAEDVAVSVCVLESSAWSRHIL